METVRDRMYVSLSGRHARDFRLVPKVVTLNDLYVVLPTAVAFGANDVESVEARPMLRLQQKM